MGRSSLSADQFGQRTTAVGYFALGAMQSPDPGGTDTNNMKQTAVGYAAGGSLLTGHTNTLIGYQAGDALTDGTLNVCLGADADAGASDASNAICIGTNITAATNRIVMGKSGNTITNDFTSNGTFAQSSDQRLKTNIQTASLGLDFINDLRPVTYKWKASTDLDASDSELNHLRVDKEFNSVDHTDFDGTVVNTKNTDITMHGLIAQEVKTALDTAGVSNFNGWGTDDKGVQLVSREMYVMPLIKAVQELSTKLDAALARIATLEG